MTTRPLVKSSTLTDEASMPALASSKPSIVVLSRVVSPVISSVPTIEVESRFVTPSTSRLLSTFKSPSASILNRSKFPVKNDIGLALIPLKFTAPLSVVISNTVLSPVLSRRKDTGVVRSISSPRPLKKVGVLVPIPKFASALEISP